MRGPPPQMAQLILVAGKDAANTSPIGEPFIVPFNPTTLKVTYTNSVSNESGKDGAQSPGKQSAEFSVELIFDTTDSSASSLSWGDATAKGQVKAGQDVDVRIFTGRIVAMMKPNEKASNLQEKNATPRVRFVWGSFLFDGVLKSITESLELFSARGIPLRAILSLSLTQDTLEFPKASNNSAGSSSLFTPMSGASAAGAMVSLGLDPLAGKLMAAMNGLDDLRQLPAGVALSVPSIAASASASVSVGASASASFGVSLGASASLGGSVSAAAAGGFGSGQGVSITLGGGGNFGLDAGASLGVGVGVSAGLNLGLGIGGGLGFGVGLGIGANAGLNLGVTGGIGSGISSGGQAAMALPGSGAVGGPRNGSNPGAQLVMDPGGRMALAPAAAPAPIVPPSSSPAVATDRTRTAPPPSPGGIARAGAPDGSSRVSGVVGVAARIASSSSGLPTPLPPQSQGAARGAFEGIHGVPLKRPRFSVGVAPLRPLAYRRLTENGPGTDPVDSSIGSVAALGSAASAGCGCAKCRGTQGKGARCACQH